MVFFVEGIWFIKVKFEVVCKYVIEVGLCVLRYVFVFCIKVSWYMYFWFLILVVISGLEFVNFFLSIVLICYYLYNVSFLVENFDFVFDFEMYIRFLGVLFIYEFICMFLFGKGFVLWNYDL